MAIGLSLFLIAVGAVLAFAVDYRAAGVDIPTVGVILMLAGALGIVISMLFWSSIGGLNWMPRRRTYVGDDHYADPAEPPVYRDEVVERTVIRDEHAAPRIRHPRV